MLLETGTTRIREARASSPAPLRLLWGGRGLRVVAAGAEAPAGDGDVVYVGRSDEPQALALNHRQRDGGGWLVLVTPLADGALVGPLVQPGHGACLECLRAQIELCALDARLCEPVGDVTGARERLLSQVERLGLEEGVDALVGARVRLDSAGRVVARADIARFPDCPGCPPPERVPLEVHSATQLLRRAEDGHGR